MKTFLKKSITAVVAFTLLSMSGYASAPFIKVRTYDAKKFSLVIHANSSSPVQITLKDENDYEFYNESLKGYEGYGKKFDLQSLPDGKYYLEIENKEVIEVFPLFIESGLLVIDKASKVVLHKPHVIQEGNKVAITIGESVNVPLKLQITNRSNDIIYSDTLSHSTKSKKKYDLSQLEPGSYTMSLSLAGRSFFKSINVK